MYWQFLIHFSAPPQVQVAPIAGGVVAAIVVILLCITTIPVVCLKRRKQHANLTRYVASPCELVLKLLCRSNINPFLIISDVKYTHPQKYAH